MDARPVTRTLWTLDHKTSDMDAVRLGPPDHPYLYHPTTKETGSRLLRFRPSFSTEALGQRKSPWVTCSRPPVYFVSLVALCLYT